MGVSSGNSNKDNYLPSIGFFALSNSFVHQSFIDLLFHRIMDDVQDGKGPSEGIAALQNVCFVMEESKKHCQALMTMPDISDDDKIIFQDFGAIYELLHQKTRALIGVYDSSGDSDKYLGIYKNCQDKIAEKLSVYMAMV